MDRKIIIAGSRTFNDYNLLKFTLDTLIRKYPKEDKLTFISGTARGADFLGEQYAKSIDTEVLRFPADWDRYGKSAGYIRNAEMGKIANTLVAFWDYKSAGTRNMIEIMKKKNADVYIINTSKVNENARISYETKDILTVKSGIICHQVNCRKAMGKGLALQIRSTYPEVYEKYLETKPLLGRCALVKVSEELQIANLYGQYNYGNNIPRKISEFIKDNSGKIVHTDYKAVALCLQKLFNYANKNNKKVYLPYNMGCTLGGGDWNVVSSIISILTELYKVDVTICKLPERIIR